jgi:hypothetical protein
LSCVLSAEEGSVVMMLAKSGCRVPALMPADAEGCRELEGLDRGTLFPGGTGLQSEKREGKR